MGQAAPDFASRQPRLDFTTDSTVGLQPGARLVYQELEKAERAEGRDPANRWELLRLSQPRASPVSIS